MGTLVNIRKAPDAAELDLVEACRRGEPAALRTVFVTHGPYLERVLRRVAGPRLEVEDLLQSTYMAAIAAFPRFRGEAEVRTWLTRIAVRVTHDRLRRAEHRLQSPVDVIEAYAALAARGSHEVEHDLDQRRRVARLYGYLDAISAKKRIAFVLHVFDGRPIEEVAALMGASVTATKSRVFWARRELLRRATRDPLLARFVEEKKS